MKLKSLLKKPVFITIIAIGFVLACAGMVYYSLTKSNISQPIFNQSGEMHVNKYGQKWWLNYPGKNVLEFSGNKKTGPEIVKGTIDPLKVSVGQRQTMEIEVNSSVNIKKVTAYITTDNNVVEVELKQTGVRELTYDDISNRQAFVKDDGELVLKTELESDPKYVLKTFIDNLFTKAKASNKQRYTFSGDWIVYDTRETTYNTKFVVVDEKSQEDMVTMAWSDPCTLPLSKNVSWLGSPDDPEYSGYFNVDKTQYIFNNTTCSENKLDGIENVDYVVRSGITVTIQVGTIVRTPGNKIIVSGGQLALPDQPGADPNIGKIIKSKIWLLDRDGDGYFKSNVLDANSAYMQAKYPNPPSLTELPPITFWHLPIIRNIYIGFVKLTDKVFDHAKADIVACNDPGQPQWIAKGDITDNNNPVATSTPIVDCDDSRKNAHPNTTIFCEVARANESFDYNCDGQITKQYNTTVTNNYLGTPLCIWLNTNPLPYPSPEVWECVNNNNINPSTDLIDGYLSLPECGQTADYLSYTGIKSYDTNCTNKTASGDCNAIKIRGTTTPQIQMCR